MVDGGSKDSSRNIIDSYAGKFSHCISEKDNGQYDAVEKGFALSTGEIMAWINSDDVYMPGAFFTVNEIFQSFREVDWLMGYPGEISAFGTPFHRISLPWSRWSKWRYYTNDFQFIQQESCFWRRKLWETSGAKMSSETNLASDMELWARFFRHAKLYTTISGLAAFRQHSVDQRSKKYRGEYLSECNRIIHRERVLLPFLQRIYLIPLRIIGFCLWPLFFYEIPLLKVLYIRLFGIPKLINFDEEMGQHIFSERVMKLPPIVFFGKNITSNTFRRKY